MNLDLEREMHKFRELGFVHSKAKAERVRIQNFLRSKRALLVVEAQQKAGISAIKHQEAYACRHKEYIDLINGLAIATEREEQAKNELEEIKLKIDIWRTRSANSRVERKGYGA